MKCLRCGHEWITRTDKPKACPACKRYLSEFVSVKPTEQQLTANQTKFTAPTF